MLRKVRQGISAGNNFNSNWRDTIRRLSFSQSTQRRKNMPEVALEVGELQTDSPGAAGLALHKDHAAFPLLFRDAIHKQNSLPALNLGCHREQAAVRAYGLCHRDVAEWPVVGRAPINAHRNAQWQALAAASFFLALCFGLSRSHSPKITATMVSVNSTVPQVQPSQCAASNHPVPRRGQHCNRVHLTLANREC